MKPSRPLANGREARSGSSLRVLIARIAANPAIGSGWMQASVPPTRTTSARSKRSRSRPQRIASAPEAQALPGACTPPLAPIARPTAAAGPLGMSIGMVKGETRFGPFSSKTSSWPSRVSAPPMPVPKTTAMRSGGTSSEPAPDSSHASWAATTAACWLRSSRRARTRSRCSTGSLAIRATSWAGYSLTQSSVMRLIPDRPASNASHVLATSPPSGVVAPRPVMTTSLLMVIPLSGRAAGKAPLQGPAASVRAVGGRGVLLLVLLDVGDLLVLLDVGDRVAHGLDVAELVVGDGDAELVLDGGGDLDHRQRVDVEVLGEGLLGSGVGRGDAGHLLQDLAETGLDLLGAYQRGVLSLGGSSVRRHAAAVVRDGRPGRSMVQGRRRTCPAKVSPAPYPRTRARSPDLASPDSSSSVSASGIEAAEVLPDCTMSRATTVRSGRPSFLVIDSTMRRLAWCGAKTSMSSGPTPAASMASTSVSVSFVVARGWRAWAAIAMNPVPTEISIALCWSPSLPQATGPMRGSSVAPIT